MNATVAPCAAPASRKTRASRRERSRSSAYVTASPVRATTYAGFCGVDSAWTSGNTGGSVAGGRRPCAGPLRDGLGGCLDRGLRRRMTRELLQHGRGGGEEVLGEGALRLEDLDREGEGAVDGLLG